MTTELQENYLFLLFSKVSYQNNPVKKSLNLSKTKGTKAHDSSSVAASVPPRIFCSSSLLKFAIRNPKSEILLLFCSSQLLNFLISPHIPLQFDNYPY